MRLCAFSQVPNIKSYYFLSCLSPNSTQEHTCIHMYADTLQTCCHRLCSRQVFTTSFMGINNSWKCPILCKTHFTVDSNERNKQITLCLRTRKFIQKHLWKFWWVGRTISSNSAMMLLYYEWNVLKHIPLLNRTRAYRDFRSFLLNSKPPTSPNFAAAAKTTKILPFLPQTEN